MMLNNLIYIFIIIQLYFVINGYTKKQVNLGFLFVRNSPLLLASSGYLQSAGVVTLALDQIKNEKLLPDYNYTFHIFYDDCLVPRASSGAYELIHNNNVDVIFGSTCNLAAIRATLMAKFYSVPTFVWGAVSTTDIANFNRLPNVFSTYSVFFSLGIATIDVLEQFNWTTVAFIYTTNYFQRCQNMFIDFERALNYMGSRVHIVQSFKTSFDPSYEEFGYFLKTANEKTRVILSCFEDDMYKRKFLISMFDNGLNNDEWVHINMEYKNFGFYTNVKNSSGEYYLFYKDIYNSTPDGRSDDAFQMAKKMFSIDLMRRQSTSLIDDKEILENIKKWPFYCSDCDVSNLTTLSRYVWYLNDAIYLWASLLNKTLPLYGDEVFTNYSLLRQHCPGTYSGKTGDMNYERNCIRTAYLQLRGLDDSESSSVYFIYNFSSVLLYNKELKVDDFAKRMFANWGNKIPLNVPTCGYKSNSCPIDIFKNHLKEVIIVGVIIIILILFFAILVIYVLLKTHYMVMRTAYLQLRGLDDSESSSVYFIYNFSSVLLYNKELKVDDFAKRMFANWGNKIPLNVPTCGYKSNSCPIDIFKNHLKEVIIVGVIIIILILFFAILVIYVLLKTNRKKNEELTRWIVPYIKLEKRIPAKNEIEKSLNSFTSSVPSQSSKNILNTKRETGKFMFVYLGGEAVAGEKHSLIFEPSKEQKIELSKLLSWEHDNINKFYGMSLDAKLPLSLWKYCKRGSLFDILQSDNSIFDAFFLVSLIKDLVEGLHFIHNSFLHYHGRLTSKNCLISDRWQLKISDFNLFSYRSCQKMKTKDKFWTAPEILRNDNLTGSQEGDIYSFAIICSEILTKKFPYDYNNRKESVEEIIYLVKRGGHNHLRPDIEIPPNMDINMTYVTIIKDSWSEEIEKRPTIKQIKHIIGTLKETGAKNLMDHVFGILEDYASTLRLEIEERSKELKE
uniref:guanylate cyclase n=1 Tax=Strongyloides papillosus TaxID=174720 RepID=A0A0N5B6W5_STREA